MRAEVNLLNEFFFQLVRTPERAVLVDSSRTLTTGELVGAAQSLVHRLKALGLGPGDRFGVQLPNGANFVVCYLAALYGGFTIVPLNKNLSAEDLEFILRQSEPKFVIDSNFQFPATRFEALRPAAPGLFAICYTSGTSARPKGVAHSVGSLLGNARAFNVHADLGPETRMFHVMPMGYMAGFLNTLLCPLLCGGLVVLGKRFEASSALSFWEPALAADVNTVWLTPTMLAVLSRMNRGERIPDWASKNLRNVFVGTAPLLRDVRESFESTFGVVCRESYGTTELLLVSAQNLGMATHGSVGKPLGFVQIELDGDGESAGIVVKSPFAFEGYIGVDGQVERVQRQSMDTGDLGYLSPEGELYITGRKKDLIIKGGINVSPKAIEEILVECPLVDTVAVVGKPHAFWGEEIACFVIPVAKDSWDEQLFLSFAKERLSSDNMPTVIRVVESFPLSSVGKVQKKLLRDLL